MIKGEWVIIDMLRALLPYVEHHYHTNPDHYGHWWSLVVAIRNITDPDEAGKHG